MKNTIHFMYRIYPKHSIKKIENKMKLLGSWNKDSVEKFLILRIISSILVFLVGLISFDGNIIISILLMILLYLFIPYLCLDRYIIKKNKKLEYDSILFFQVLSLSLESGKDLFSALNTTCNSIDSNLSDEFKRVIREVNYGKGLETSLYSLRDRISSTILKNTVLNMIECYTTGGNLVETLNNQVEYIRNSRVLELKGKINKLPIEISVVSVILVIPMILLLIIGPIIINYIK